MQITLSNDEKLEFFHNALCNGLQIMPGYGLRLEYDETQYKEAKTKLTSPCFEDVLLQIIKDGGHLEFVDIEGDGDQTKRITLDNVLNRIEKTPSRHLSDMANENDDADTADAILQTVFYEDIIFG